MHNIYPCIKALRCQPHQAEGLPAGSARQQHRGGPRAPWSHPPRNNDRGIVGPRIRMFWSVTGLAWP